MITKQELSFKVNTTFCSLLAPETKKYNTPEFMLLHLFLVHNDQMVGEGWAIQWFAQGHRGMLLGLGRFL